MPSRAESALPAVLVVLVALAVHAGTLGNGFVWDDEVVVLDSSRTLGQVLLSPDEVAPYYRPLSRASYFVDRALFGMNPRGHHAVNVALHGGCVLLLYLLARRLFDATSPAVLAALLLAVHPIHVEAVAFVTARNNLFALLFSLAALLVFLQERSALSGLAAFLAMASKEQGAMVLPVIAACAFPSRAWRRLLPHGVALAAYLVLRAVALRGAPAGEGTELGLGSRLLSAASGFAEYLRLVVWPADLTILHSEPVPSLADLVPWLGLVLLLVWLLRRPTPAARVGALWLGFGMLPLSGLVAIPSATVAERYVYAVLPGLWLLLAEAWRREPRKVAVPVAAILLLLVAGRTIDRARDWHDDVSLARSAVEVDPSSAPARFNLGVALKDAGDLAGAEREWSEALRLRPDDAETMTQLGTAAAVRGDLSRAEDLFRRALALEPDLAMARSNLARICERTGRMDEARRLDPTF
jgi:tetratricopeptide (TPR) repeat protein